MIVRQFVVVGLVTCAWSGCLMAAAQASTWGLFDDRTGMSLEATVVPDEGNTSYAGLVVFCDADAIDGLNVDVIFGQFDEPVPDEFDVWTRLDDEDVRVMPFVFDWTWFDSGYPLFYEDVSAMLADLDKGGTLYLRAFLFDDRADADQPTYTFEVTGFAAAASQLACRSEPVDEDPDEDPFGSRSSPSAQPASPAPQTTPAVAWEYLSTLDDGSPLYVADGGEVIVGLTCNGPRVNVLVGIFGGPAIGATDVRFGLATYALEPFGDGIQRAVATEGRGDPGLTAAYGLELAFRSTDALDVTATVSGTVVHLLRLDGGASFEAAWSGLPCS